MVSNVIRVEQGKSYATPGGVAISVDGVPKSGPQPIIDLISVPGVSPSVAEDLPNLRNNVSVLFDGMALLASSGSISGTAVASTPIFTVPGGEILTVELAVVRCLTAAGITAPPTAGVGFNGAADNIFASQIMTGLTTAGKVYVFPLGGIQFEAISGSVISFGLDVGALGGTMTLAVDLIGRSA